MSTFGGKIRARCDVARQLVQQHIDYGIGANVATGRSLADVSRALDTGTRLLVALEQVPDPDEDFNRVGDELQLMQWAVINAAVLASAPLCVVVAGSVHHTNELRSRLAHHMCVILLGIATSTNGMGHPRHGAVMEAYKALLPIATRAVPEAS
jgi:hypothetical protein